MRIAVYVEGHTELIFLCLFLRKWFKNDASKVGIRYWGINGVRPIKHNLEFGAMDSQNSYLIINAGNDNKALSEALKRASNQREIGFDKLLVLRDMFSKDYDKANCLIPHGIDANLNEKFIHQAAIAIENRNCKGFMECHFAIMEIEAWLLGMDWILEKLNSSLTIPHIESSLKIDLKSDPETTMYRPAKQLAKILKSVGDNYRKKEDEVLSIMNLLEKSDFERLILSGKCKSFSKFVGSLINNTLP